MTEMIQVTNGVMKTVKEVADSEGMSPDETLSALVELGKQARANGHSKAKTDGSALHALPKEVRAMVKEVAKLKGISEDEALISTLKTGHGRYLASRRYSTKSPAKAPKVKAAAKKAPKTKAPKKAAKKTSKRKSPAKKK